MYHKKRISKRQQTKKPWVTKEIKNAIENRDKLFKKFSKEKNPILKTNILRDYKLLRNHAVEKLRTSKRDYYRTYFNRNVRNSRNIWKGIKQLINCNKNMSTNKITININEKLETNDKIIAEEFNTFFCEITKKIREKIPPSKRNLKAYLKNRQQNSLFFQPITYQEIEKVLREIDPNKATGPYSIPNKILNMLSTDISRILAKIFNLSITTGKFISQLKTAKVIPVYKNKGSNLEISNYRPIALLSNIDKIFEKLIHQRIVAYLDKHNLIYKRQFGFRKKHSTVHSLIALTEKIRSNLDKGNFTCGIFLDLQKAFDSVDHEILLEKLKHYGVRGICSDWIRTYLTARNQFVSVNGVNSSSKEPKYGVPQGPVLGPLFFILYINDLQDALLYSKSFIYADDTAIAYSNKSLKRMKKRLNIDLKLLADWLSANKIALNVSKTETILFRKVKQKVDYNLKLKLNGKKLPFTHFTKYVGLFIDQHLSWNIHFNHLAKKLSTANSIISKLRHYVPTETLTVIYHALFSSHIKYGLTVWGQNLSKNNRISKLQKTAVRLMTFSRHNAHSRPLFQRLNLLTLDETIHLTNITLAYQTLKNETPSAIQDALNLQHVFSPLTTRGSTRGLLKRPGVRTTTYGLFSIRYRLVVDWNTIQLSYDKKLTVFSISRVKSLTTEKLSLFNT